MDKYDTRGKYSIRLCHVEYLLIMNICHTPLKVTKLLVTLGIRHFHIIKQSYKQPICKHLDTRLMLRLIKLTYTVIRTSYYLEYYFLLL